MTKRTYLLCSLGLLVGLGLSGVQLNAQQTADPQSPNSPSQPPAQQTAPDSQAQSQQAQVQTFAGTIVKAGDKYVLQDASGTSFDVDRQDLVKSHEGKKVRINGTLDADGKTIHVK
jgi:uncharacterized protein YdeI (BOF family)